MTTAPLVQAPETAFDPYSDEALLDPWPGYRKMRDAGPVVRLSKYDGMFAATRYSSVRRILQDGASFPSGKGVMMNEPMNAATQGITLCTDGQTHDALRRVIVRPLTPKALKPLHEEIDQTAEELVERLVGKGEFDAVTELAYYLPVTIVSNLVGLPEEGRERMLEWAFDVFNSFGPLSPRTERSFAVMPEILEYAATQAVPGKLKSGSWAEAVHKAADAGEIPREACAGLMIDYMTPSLDTTIFAISSAVWLFAQNPDQWDLVREDPSLLKGALNEVLRLESPIQDFSRSVERDYDLDGVVLPAGSRVVTFYGAANRDERHYTDPDRFDIRRNPTDHLGFGAGEHACVGMNLARLEMVAVFTALAKRVRRFELGEHERALHNILRGFRRLDVKVSI